MTAKDNIDQKQIISSQCISKLNGYSVKRKRFSVFVLMAY